MARTLAFRPIKVARASAEVVDQIKARIFDDGLSSGAQLASEKDLADQFGLSRLTIRDALRVLESEGLVEIRLGAHGGAFVARPSPDRVSDSLVTQLRLQQISVRDLVEARLSVEPQVAALAAERAGAEDLAAMDRAIGGAIETRASGDPRFMPHSVAFHVALAEAARNQVLLFMVNSFMTSFHQALAAVPDAGGMADRAIADHRRILRAVRARDGAAARRLMRGHIVYFAARVPAGPAGAGARPAARSRR